MRRIAILLLLGFLGLIAPAIADAPSTPQKLREAVAQPPDKITRHEYTHPENSGATAYLLYAPASDTPPAERALLIFLYGAGGSIDNYNFKRPPYAALRAQLAARGYYVAVPDLGKHHFMNDAAKAALDGVVAQILAQQDIPPNRVHVMGTSMGAGSSLAYAIHRPDMIRSVCAVMPMTDFAGWVVENPHYVTPVATAYGGTYAERPEAYEKNSAVKNVAAFANIPVMLVHGDADSIVRYEHSQRLAELLRGRDFACTLYTAAGQGHKDEVMGDFQAQAMAFFEAANK